MSFILAILLTVFFCYDRLRWTAATRTTAAVGAAEAGRRGAAGESSASTTTVDPPATRRSSTDTERTMRLGDFSVFVRMAAIMHVQNWGMSTNARLCTLSMGRIQGLSATLVSGHLAGRRNKHFHSSLDGCPLFTWRGPEFCPVSLYK